MTTVGVPGSLLGVLREVDLTDQVVELAPGAQLVLFTDGVTEGRQGRELYGDDRLERSVLAHQDAGQPAEAILGEVLDFQNGTARDDIAVVVVRVPTDGPGTDAWDPDVATMPR